MGSTELPKLNEDRYEAEADIRRELDRILPGFVSPALKRELLRTMPLVLKRESTAPKS